MEARKQKARRTGAGTPSSTLLLCPRASPSLEFIKVADVGKKFTNDKRRPRSARISAALATGQYCPYWLGTRLHGHVTAYQVVDHGSTPAVRHLLKFDFGEAREPIGHDVLL